MTARVRPVESDSLRAFGYPSLIFLAKGMRKNAIRKMGGEGCDPHIDLLLSDGCGCPE